MQRKLVLGLELGYALCLSTAIIYLPTPAARGGGNVCDDLGREGGREGGSHGSG